jgi:hypothetical protein
LGRLSAAKEVLTGMNAVNGCIKAAAATVGAFYTLWALIVLHPDALPPAPELAKRYASFSELATQIRENVDPTQLKLLPNQEPLRESALKYAKALQGAHTDLAPRTARLESLLQAMSS